MTGNMQADNVQRCQAWFNQEPEDPRYSATISDSVQSLEEPDYVFAEVEASQEETEKTKPEFSLRDAVVNQTILERKYH